MTLLAGIIAFAAVIIQIRSSSRQVREQITAQRDAEREETERQKRAVANAILSEIDETYRFLLRDVHGFLRTIDPKRENLRDILIKSFVARFPILDANAGKIGDLGEDTVGNVVGSYSCIRAYLISLDNFALSHERWLSKPGDALLEERTREFLSDVKNAIPSLICLAHEASKELCNILSKKFEAPGIALAAEDMDALREEVTKMGDGGIIGSKS